MKTKDAVYLLISNLVTAFALAFALGFSLETFGKCVIMITFNIFAIPLALVFRFPLWVWYVFVATWIGNIYFVSEEDGNIEIVFE